MLRAAFVCCVIGALGLTAFVVWTLRTPSFELVAYYAQGETLQAETLDSGLTAQDCAYALERAALEPSSAVLTTCERER